MVRFFLNSLGNWFQYFEAQILQVLTALCTYKLYLLNEYYTSAFAED